MEERIERMRKLLDERQWRLYLANEAISAGYGGISKVSRISDVPITIMIGCFVRLKYVTDFLHKSYFYS